MPTQEFHQFYWNVSSTKGAPLPPTARFGGYPTWQTSAVTLGSGFGGVLPWYERAVDAVRWFWRLFRRSLGMNATQRKVVLRALSALEHPAFPIAQSAVKKTATTLAFNRPEAWKELSRELKGSHGHAENAFRHLEACRLVRANLLNSTISNPDCHLIVELAYHAYRK